MSKEIVDEIGKKVSKLKNDEYGGMPPREWLPNWRNAQGKGVTAEQYQALDVYTNDFVRFAVSIYYQFNQIDGKYKMRELVNEGKMVIKWHDKWDGTRYGYVHERKNGVTEQDVKSVLCNDFDSFIKLIRQ